MDALIQNGSVSYRIVLGCFIFCNLVLFVLCFGVLSSVVQKRETKR